MNFGYRTSFQLLDKGNIELFGPSGLSFNLSVFSKVLASLQTGFVFHYSFIIMISTISFICLFLVLHGGLVQFVSSVFLLLMLSYTLFSVNTA
jgi:NADH-ubiquinone oxidoreductase chain 5